MGMTELIFGYKKIFGSGHFLIFFQISWIKKMPRAKKVVYLKNQFFHARQPREGIFDIRISDTFLREMGNSKLFFGM